MAINLATNARNAESLCDNNGYALCMDRLVKTHDPLLCKMMRNISQHDKLKPLFKKNIADLCLMATRTDNPDLLVESLGILGNLDLSDVNVPILIKQYTLVEFVYKHMVPGYSEDDIVLEVIIFLGSLILNDEVASLIAKSPIIRALCDVFVGM